MIKLQHLAVIFIIVMLPLTMVLSVYISTQIDTMNLQTAYITKLHDATHDAIEAFQLNTRNNEYSTVADSLKRDVAAAINTFFTSLAQNIGMSGYAEQELQPYIPAIACTMYDGYYIYSPTKTGTGAEDIENVLKQYIYYTARYVGIDTDVIINYSLDSYISIYGKVNNEYVSRSGYLIPYGSNGITKINYEGGLSKATDITISKPGEELKSDDKIRLKDGAIWKGKNQISVNSIIYNGKEITEESEKIVSKNNKNQYESKNNNKDAIYYYLEALEFSRYINELGLNSAISSASKVYINEELIYSSDSSLLPAGKTNKIAKPKDIFNLTSSDPLQDPENIQSNFVNHKREIIKLSIENNLQIAFNNYVGNASYDYQLPKLTDEDWEKVYKNVSMISFMQGLQVGSKIFNDYAVVTSTGNEEYIDPENLYFIKTDSTDPNKGTYHRIDCEELENEEYTGYKSCTYIKQNKIISTSGKDIIHDGNGNKVKSGYILKDINDQSLEACYKCIIESKGETLYGNDGKLLGTIESLTPKPDRKIISYYTALARERYNLMRLKATRILNSSLYIVETI